MSEKSTTYVLLIVTAILLVGSSFGFVVNDGLSTQDHEPRELVNSMLTNDPSVIEGRFSKVIKQNNTVVERRSYNVTKRPESGEKRIRISSPDGTITTLVENETTVWVYDHNDREVIRHELDTPEEGFTISEFSYDYYGTLVEQFRVRYAGTDQVAGRTAHVLVFTDPSDEERTASLNLIVGNKTYELAKTNLETPLVLNEHRLWIDAEQSYPLKKQTTLTGDDGESVTYTFTSEQISFTSSTGADTFEFDPPEDTQMRSSPAKTSETFSSIDAAQAAVSYRVPDPTVPEEYDFRGVVVSRQDNTTNVVVQYISGTDKLGILVWPQANKEFQGMDVTIGEQEGTLTRERGKRYIWWQCANRTYAVYITGEEISVNKHITVAESINCT